LKNKKIENLAKYSTDCLQSDIKFIGKLRRIFLSWTEGENVRMMKIGILRLS